MKITYQDLFGNAIDKIGGCSKIMWLVGERKRCMIQKRKTNFNYMMMATFRKNHYVQVYEEVW